MSQRLKSPAAGSQSGSQQTEITTTRKQMPGPTACGGACLFFEVI